MLHKLWLIKQVAPQVHTVKKSIAAVRSCGAFLLTERAGSAPSSNKIVKAQTLGHQAPGCKDALSGLDPANHSCPQLNEGQTDE